MDQVLLQWNCRSAIDKKSEIIFLINKYNASIVCLSETWLVPAYSFRISGFNTVRRDRADRHGGVAILINSSIPYKQFCLPPLSDGIEAIAIIVNNICIVSVYIPHPSISLYSELSDMLQSLPQPFLVVGDFNCQHQAWGGSSRNNFYGEEMLNILDSLNLCILNDGTPTRRTRPNEEPSAPDLSICCPNLASILSWFIHPYTCGSDHFPITIAFPSLHPNIPQKPKPRMKYRLPNNWSVFSQEVESRISNLPSVCPGNEEICSNALIKAMTEVADALFPIKKGGSNRIPSPPWWDRECTEAIKRRKEAERVYSCSMTPENFELYSQVACDTRKLLKRKKFEGWRNFCSNICPDVNASIVWENIKRFRMAVNPSSRGTLSPKLAEQFLDNLAPPSVPELQMQCTFPMSVSNNSTGLNAPFSISEIKGILTSLKDTSPGQDGIPYSFFCNCSDITLIYFLSIINSVMSSGCIPKSWKFQSVIPILKPNKSPSYLLTGLLPYLLYWLSWQNI